MTNWYLTKVLRGPLSEHPWVTIGNFDGCHRGHQALFRESLDRSNGRGLVLTFFPHPVAVFKKSVFRHIDTLSFRIEKMLREGFAQVWVVHFSAELRKISWESFLKTCLLDSGVRAEGVCVGADFGFGRERGGNAHALGRWCARHSMGVKIVDDVTVEGRRVSSQWVREALGAGDLTTVVEKLGVVYALCGVVQKGRQLGHKLGFPTANIVPDAYQVLPPFGVYVAETKIDRRRIPSIVNIGVRPTIVGKQHPVVVESHMLSFNETVYGKYIQIRLLCHLRGERKFESLKALKTQIAKDVSDTNAFFDTQKPGYSE